MKFSALPLAGAFIIALDPITDERGFFARAFCQHEFRAQGLHFSSVQSNLSWNQQRNTLRGLHYQDFPHPEVKLVRCTRGAIWDVIVDLRADSPTYRQWYGVELSAANRLSLYLPQGFAHGFQTLSDDSEVLYEMSEFYHADLARGVRWDDPALNIHWPLADPILSERDRSYAPLS